MNLEGQRVTNRDCPARPLVTLLATPLSLAAFGYAWADDAQVARNMENVKYQHALVCYSVARWIESDPGSQIHAKPATRGLFHVCI